MDGFTKDESTLLLAMVNESAFKGQAAELVVEIKKKLNKNIMESVKNMENKR